SESEMPPITVTQRNPTVLLDVNNGGVTPVISGSGSTVTNLIVSKNVTITTPTIISVDSFDMVAGKKYLLASELDMTATVTTGKVRGIYIDGTTKYIEGSEVLGGNKGTSYIFFTAPISGELTIQYQSYTGDSNNKVFGNTRVYEVTGDDVLPYIKGTQNLTDVVIDVRGENLVDLDTDKYYNYFIDGSGLVEQR
ncbi:hypothetical protein ADUPG1_002598, partial [Aduncisulcus paluster]